MGEQTTRFDQLALGSSKPEQATEVELAVATDWANGLQLSRGLWFDPQVLVTTGLLPALNSLFYSDPTIGRLGGMAEERFPVANLLNNFNFIGFQ
ncbi:hypothetical protein SAMN02982919_03234 [Giesbergeria anulus]|uniref:Uncharacterized protein n=1 Tax=Giesbergeria anulus TaxID=180197 RepID=A0A1H9SVH5_9BURK|nr:hypothetical protein SAMN02982919_03234 [Giesbergeria anulus]